MSRSRQLTLVLIVAISIAAIGSHCVASWLKVKTIAAEAFTIGKSNGSPPAFMAGSSVAGYGIAWDEISTQLDLEIKAWGIAAASPYEEEQFQKQVPEAHTTFLVVSPVDLDEASISDFRAAIVPLGQTIQTLLATHADCDQWKRALNQYPLTWLRTLFPTLGRSRGIMGMLRLRAADLIKHPAHTSETMAGPIIKFGKDAADDEYRRQRLSDWSESKVIGKLVAMREDFHDAHAFNGPKQAAFKRMLQYGIQKGRTIVIVLPVSPAYTQGLLSPELTHEFETALTAANQDAPGAEWLRLDQLPGLASNENFCDLNHLNVFGRQIATEALQLRLKQPARQP